PTASGCGRTILASKKAFSKHTKRLPRSLAKANGSQDRGQAFEPTLVRDLHSSQEGTYGGNGCPASRHRGHSGTAEAAHMVVVPSARGRHAVPPDCTIDDPHGHVYLLAADLFQLPFLL